MNNLNIIAKIYFLVLLGLAFSAFSSGRLIASDKESLERPNIVFLLADDQRYDTLGVTGNTILKTPELDRLANEGVLFENSFVVSSACAPNRAAIFSGMYNRSSGVRDFSANFSAEQQELLYPFLLKGVGYTIGFIGKWGVASTIEATVEPYAERFDYWRGFAEQGSYFPEGKDGEHLTQLMAEQAEEFFETAPHNKPFCLSISFKAPHGPWKDYDRRFAHDFENEAMPYPVTLSDEAVMKLPEFMRTYRLSLNGQSVAEVRQFHQSFMREYYRLILGLDEAVGKIRQSLERLGLAENTIIIYTSDNGHFLHEWGFHGKWLMYEPSIKVPLIIYDPRDSDIGQGKRSDGLALSIDYAPTMLDYAGVDVPDTMQGVSLLPLVEGDVPDDWRDDIFYDYAFEMYPGDIPKSIGVRTDRYKLVRYTGPRPQYEQLFDLNEDPLELNNLIDNPDYFAIRHDLRQRLSQYRQELPDRSPDYQEYVNSYEVVGIGSDFPDREVELKDGGSLGQTFKAETNELVLAEWRWPFSIKKYPKEGVRVVLRRGGPLGEWLGEVTLDPKSIYNLNLARARFDVACLTPGETLYVSLEPIGSGNGIRIWQYTDDTFERGASFVNGAVVEGDFPMSFVFRK